MSYRTDPTSVRSMVDVKDSLASSLNIYIRQANNITNRIAAVVGYTHTVDDLWTIETLLAAHYYSLKDPLYTSRSIGSASGSFARRNFWEEAQKLDPTGTLAAMESGQRVDIIYLGKGPRERTPYWNQR